LGRDGRGSGDPFSRRRHQTTRHWTANLERCDGQHTFREIISGLQKEFGMTDPEKIRADIGVFLEQLQKKRIVDY
jgi:hypothetical protein